MRAKVFMVASLAALVGIPGVASAGGPQPRPQAQALPPDRAAALATAPALATVVVAPHRVTPAAALAAAARPGAATDVAPGLSVDQAVGLTPDSSSNPSAVRRLARSMGALFCYSGTQSVQFGYWPYQQVVYDNTFWCAYWGGQITYRSTNASHSGMLCDGSGDYTYRLAGGTGDVYAAYRVGAYFACTTVVPWVTLRYNDSLDAEVNDFGNMFWYTARQQ